MLALGADDFSISIWRNTRYKPIVVLHDIFNRPLLDLCWSVPAYLFEAALIIQRSNDGHHLYGCSGDGTICAISFDGQELPELAAPESTQIVLDEYQYRPSKRAIARPIASHTGPPAVNGFGALHVSTAHVNVLQPRKGKPAHQRRRIDQTGSRAKLPSSPEDAFSSAPLQPFASPSATQASTARMFQDAHSAFPNGSRYADGETGEHSRMGTKRKASLLPEGTPRAPQGRTVSSAPSRQFVVVKESPAPRVPSQFGSLSVVHVQRLLRAKPRDGDESVYFEAQNAENARGKTKVTYCANGHDRWLDYLPAAVLALAITSTFCAAACEEGSVFVYSPAGRQ